MVVLLAAFCACHLQISHPFKVHFVWAEWLFSVQNWTFFGLEGKSKAFILRGRLFTALPTECANLGIIWWTLKSSPVTVLRCLLSQPRQQQ